MNKRWCLVAVLAMTAAGACNSSGAQDAGPAPTHVTTNAGAPVPSTAGTVLITTPATVTSTTTPTPVGRPPLYKEGLPQVTTTPSRAIVGGRVRFSGTGFTDAMWRSGDTLWLVGMSEGSCSLYAQAEGSRVTLTSDGLLEGELVVPPRGGCRQSQPPSGADIAPGTYQLAYGCTPCFIGELAVFEPGLTADSRLRADGVGPLRIGMTLEDPKQAAGTRLDTVALQGCVELVPADPSIGIGLWSHDGRTLDSISSGTIAGLATRAGIRSGSPVEAVEQAYPQLVRNTDEGTYLVVRAGAGMALAFEIRGGRVGHLFAGDQQRIGYGGHCP